MKKDNKACFVISPIGEEGSDERKHADEVLNFIIKPALLELREKNICYISAKRSDEIEEPGKITKQIYNAIRNGDLCIVDCSFLNPNVFYELAVAQCAVKPVIILAKKGTKLPFDIKDERTIFFDLDLTSYDERIYINQIIEIVRKLEEKNWEIDSSIPGFTPIISEIEKNIQYYERAHEFGSDPDWQKIIDDSEEILYLMGTSLKAWRYTYTDKVGENFGDILVKKANNGCKIKILIMAPENESLSQIHGKLIPVLPEEVRNTIKLNIDFFSEYVAQSKNIEFRQIRHGRLTQSQVINDKYGIYLPHFYSVKSSNLPCWKCRMGSNLYDQLMKEFIELWRINAPSKREIIEEKGFKEEIKTLERKSTEGLLVFINYATKDAEFFKIKEIAENLAAYEEIDEVIYWQEDAVDNIISFMNDNLGRCDVMLLFCSGNASQSKPIEKEWTAFDIMNKPIIPIFTKTDDIPPLLKSRLGVEFDNDNFQENIQLIYRMIFKKIIREETSLELYPKSELIDKSIKEFAAKVNSEGIVVINENSLIIGSYYKDEEKRNLLSVSTPYFLTLSDSFAMFNPNQQDENIQEKSKFVVQRFGRNFIFKQFRLKKNSHPYYILILHEDPDIDEEEFDNFANLLKEILY